MIFYMAGDIAMIFFIQYESAGPVLQYESAGPILQCETAGLVLRLRKCV